MHPIQKKIIEAFESNNGILPSFRELARIVGVASTNTVAYHVERLRKGGYLDAGTLTNNIVPLTLKTLLSLEGKPGVCVLLDRDRPFHIGSSDDMKRHLLEWAVGVDRPAVVQLRNLSDAITIAYHISEQAADREELERHLREYYREKGYRVSE